MLYIRPFYILSISISSVFSFWTLLILVYLLDLNQQRLLIHLCWFFVWRWNIVTYFSCLNFQLFSSLNMNIGWWIIILYIIYVDYLCLIGMYRQFFKSIYILSQYNFIWRFFYDYVRLSHVDKDSATQFQQLI